nr:type I-E CRISPR-associated protein Cas6/Cse3/CasE [Shuttleworthia satelles]
MYLSRVEIDFNSRVNMRELNHVGAYHNWVEQAFPEEVDRKIRSRKLWRIDCLAGKRYLLLVSEREPSRELLESRGVKGSFASKEYDTFLSTIHTGDQFRFRIVLNPVHAVLEDERKRGKVYPLYAEKDQLQFLLDRGPKHGFTVPEDQVTIVERGQERLLKKGNHSTNLVKAVYEGRLKVLDSSRFVDLLIHGMGREKAYGFGLMTVIKVK